MHSGLIPAQTRHRQPVGYTYWIYKTLSTQRVIKTAPYAHTVFCTLATMNSSAYRSNIYLCRVNGLLITVLHVLLW